MASNYTSNVRTISDEILYASLTLLDKTPVGFGGFGAVFKALHDEWGCQVAYKRLALPYIGERSDDDLRLVRLVFMNWLSRQRVYFCRTFFLRTGCHVRGKALQKFFFLIFTKTVQLCGCAFL